MFRQPKRKGAIRQRKNVDLEGNEEDKDNENVTETKNNAEVLDFTSTKKTTQTSIFSFDIDEGADAAFEVKKNNKKVEELKRLHKLEEEAERFEKERRNEENERKKQLEKVVKKEKQSKENREKKNNRQKYLERYRDVSAKHINQYDEELDLDDEALDVTNDVTNKFSSLGGIPDSRAVYEAKKRRERLRREGQDGYIPLDDDQKIRSKSVRDRLIREDENDDSDEEEPNRFYSAREILKTEEDRRREAQNEFLNQEHGDEQNDDENVSNRYYRIKSDDDNEMEEWEKQQIRKAVSGRAIGQLRNEKRNIAKVMGTSIPDDNAEMDMDIDIEIPDKPSFNGPSNTGGDVRIDDILAKLKLRIVEREEALNYRREEERKMAENLEENLEMIKKIEMDLPQMSTKFTMYQELRVYSRSLLECLNEKVSEINEISDKRRQCNKARRLRLMQRRRQDVRDQYAECSTVAAGKNINSVRFGEAATRSAEREARRRRRRKDRESTLVGISHEEGLSTDDEEITSISMADKKTHDEVDAVVSVIFADALEEYADLRKVLERMMDWLAVDSKSFQDAYVYLCLPKLSSPYVRLELISSDILKNDCSMTTMKWFHDLMNAGAENTEIDKEHEIIVGLIPAVIEKVVIPFLIDVVKDEWDPMSLKQTKRLAEFCSIFEKIPNLNEKSKLFGMFLEAIRERIMASISEDLFVPMFAPSALENSATGCRSFHDRQYWNSIKLIRSINSLSSIISVAARFELIVEKIVNATSVVALRSGCKNDVSTERKVRAIFEELDEQLLLMGGMSSFRQLIGALNQIADAQNEAGRSFDKDIRKFLAKLER